MTTQTAGRLNPEWLAGARCNEGGDETVEVWFGRALNTEVEIDAEGCVWVESRQTWLSQEQVDDACARIDAGV